MIVSHRQQFIFFHNPKCAGMSFREVLKERHDDEKQFWGPSPAPYFRVPLDHSHLRLWELHALYPRLFECALSYNSVILVRHPYKRFLAALNEHFKKFQPAVKLLEQSQKERLQVIERF